MNIRTTLYLLLALLLSHGTVSAPESGIIGSKGFIHVEKGEGAWWLMEADGERFITMGMSHIGASTRLANYNQGYRVGEFGDDLFNDAGVNWQEVSARSWMRQVAKDHRAHGTRVPLSRI